MGQNHGSAFNGGVVVVGETKNRRAGNGHVMVIGLSSTNYEESEDGSFYSILRESRGICSHSILDVVPIEGSVVALCSYPGLFLYDYKTNGILHSFRDSERRAVFLPSNSMLVSTDKLDQIKLYEIKNSTDNFRNSSLVSTFHSGHANFISSLFSNNSIHPNLIFSGSSDKTVRVQDLTTEQTIQKFTEHDDWVTRITASPIDGNIVVSGSDSATKSVHFWDLRSNELIQALNIDPVYSLLWKNHKPNLLIVGTETKGIQFVDIRRIQQPIPSLETRGKAHWGLCSIDENRFAVSTFSSFGSSEKGVCQVFGYDGVKRFETILFGNSSCCCYSPPF